MAASPFSLEAEVLVAERAGKRDLPDMRPAGKCGGICFKGCEATLNLAPLVIEPTGVVGLGGAVAPLVDLQERSIHHAVGKRLHGQGGDARGARRDDDAAAGLVVEELDDHAGIVEHRPVFQDEGRDLSKRVLAAQRVGRIVGVGDDGFHASRRARRARQRSAPCVQKATPRRFSKST